ncbi:MAG: thioredoxin fold domain-containing protein, partial [Elusimicrobiaceae bacterium]|nr:thioredoxin fold domain-containing protein [Elusimicrobiaceae bacterium]
SFAACEQQAAKPAPTKISGSQYVLPALKGPSYNFSEKIQQKPVLIAFMAGYCGWCKKMVPHMDKIAEKVDPSKVDVIIGFMDESPTTLVSLEPIQNAKTIDIYYGAKSLMMAQGVQSFPTIILFKDGKQEKVWNGYSPNHADSIIATLKKIK